MNQWGSAFLTNQPNSFFKGRCISIFYTCADQLQNSWEREAWKQVDVIKTNHPASALLMNISVTAFMS